MTRLLALALGAGLASAVLFYLPARDTFGAMAFGVLAPLPLMIVTLGYGEKFGAIASLLGFAPLGLALHPTLAGVFLLSTAAPAVSLAGMARRPAWGSPGYLLTAATGWAIVLAWSTLALLAWVYPSLDDAFADFVGRIEPLITDSWGASVDAHALAGWVVLAMAPMMAAWSLAGLAGNLWLAGRIARVSGLLHRAWPLLPQTLRLPRLAFELVGCALVLCLAPGAPRLMGACALAALTLAFAFNGMARLHAFTLGRAARGAILWGFYAISFVMFPWPLLIAAACGLADVAWHWRAGALPQPPSSTSI